jgi:rhamnose transport system permease protein
MDKRNLLRDGVLLVLLILTGFVMSRLSPDFLTSANLLETTRHFVEVGLIALAMTFIILSAGIDLSVGSNVALCAVMLGLVKEFWGWNVWLAAALALCVGTCAGVLNGALIAKLRLPPLVVTFITWQMFRGIAEGISKGNAVSDFPASFGALGQRSLGAFPMQFLLFIVACVVAYVALSRTRFGRFVYAVGNNEAATRLSGVPVDRVKILLYAVSGLMSALAAVILVSRVSTAKSDMGQSYELDAITAVVLGGTNIAGGEGGIIGTVLGLLIISAVRNGLSLANTQTGNYPNEIQAVIIGVLLIAAVWMGRRIHK